MATDFWASSHFKRWIIDNESIRNARTIDSLYVDDPDHLSLLEIFFANLISKLGIKLSLRQRVIATATVFFRRFYLKNNYCQTCPYIVLAACCYVASKAEESPIHIKNVVSEARNLFNNEYGVPMVPMDNSKLAEMEFYLMEDLECDLVVYHPYRTLMTLVRDQGPSSNETFEKEAGELGAGVDDGPRYWGTDEGKLAMQAGGIQMAWFLINDTYRSNICVTYPPHLIAISALYLTCILQPQTRRAHVEWIDVQQAALAVAQSQTHNTRRSSRQASSTDSSQKCSRTSAAPAQDFIGFFASLNVNMRLITSIAQEMIAFYALCDRFKEDFNPGPNNQPAQSHPHRGQTVAAARFARTQSQTQTQSLASTGSRSGSGTGSMPVTPSGISGAGLESAHGGEQGSFEVNSAFLIRLLVTMQANREVHLTSVNPMAVNKMLERAQAAG